MPAAKKAIVQTLLLSAARVTAAAPVGMVTSYLQHTPNGGSVITIAQANLGTNGVNDQTTVNLTQLGDMLAGDNVTAGDVDTSTGGTTNLGQNAKIFEYPA